MILNSNGYNSQVISDENLYPRTYIVSAAVRFSYALAAVFLIGVGMMLALLSANNVMAVLVACILFVIAVFMLISAFGARVTLSGDAIEIKNGFNTQRMMRDDIAGMRRLRGRRAADILVFEPKNNQQYKKLQMKMIFDKDAIFDSWIGSLDNLDKEDLERSRDAIENDIRFGQTPEERHSRLLAARKQAWAIEGMSIGICFWGMIISDPYAILAPLLAVLPFMALFMAMASNGLFRLVPLANDAHPSFNCTLILPCVALYFCNFQNMSFIDWHQGLTLAFLGGIILTALVCKADPQTKRPGNIIALFLMLSLYGYGLVGFINTLSDVTPVGILKFTVTKKEYSHGRHPQPQLLLNENPPRIHSVSAVLYKQVQVGQAVCKVVHQGWLGIGWYHLSACD